MKKQQNEVVELLQIGMSSIDFKMDNEVASLAINLDNYKKLVILIIFSRHLFNLCVKLVHNPRKYC